jgi:hypothetical protein
MLLGWHVDSNICKRLFMLYGEVGDLTDRLFGYHCDHTRQVTPAHKRTAAENSIAKFFDAVNVPGVAEQAESWGCIDTEIETFQLASGPARSYLSGLEAAIRTPMVTASEVGYVTDTFDEVSYEAEHVFPFLADLLASVPKTWNAAWFGTNRSMFELFQAAWPNLQFTGQILVPAGIGLVGEALHHTGAIAMDEVLAEADFFIFDFSAGDGNSPVDVNDASLQESFPVLIGSFHKIIGSEHRRAASKLAPRRIIAINAIHNRFEALVRGYIEYARSPFSSRLRHGYALPVADKPVSWLDLMTPKLAGERIGAGIRAKRMVRGQVASGPHLSLLPGNYILELEIEPEVLKRLPFQKSAKIEARLVSSVTPTALSQTGNQSSPMNKSKWKKSGAIAIEIRNGDNVISRSRFSIADVLMRRFHHLKIDLSEQDFFSAEPSSLNVRIWTSGWLGFLIRRLDLIAAG